METKGKQEKSKRLEILIINKMLLTKRINDFGRALFGTMYPEDYLSHITNGYLQDNLDTKYLTVADSRKNLKRDFYFVASDLKKAVKEAKEK